MTVIWTIMIGFGCAGLGYVIRMAEEGWNAAGKVLDRAAADLCRYCRGIDWTAECTCPQRCTAMVCIAPPAAAIRKGLQ